jgi:hypothetical protein
MLVLNRREYISRMLRASMDMVARTNIILFTIKEVERPVLKEIIREVEREL